MTTILCVHAHESNCFYLDKIADLLPLKIEHLVINQLNTGEELTESRLMSQITQKVTIDTAAIIITCTVYSNLIQKKKIEKIPILKIEEPLIQQLLLDKGKKILFFSNPQTVDLTMQKIETLYKEQKCSIDYDVVIIPDTFELILNNQQAEYKKAITTYIRNYLKKREGNAYLMQLSMSCIEATDFLEDAQKINTVYGSALLTYQSYFEK